jgi:hypothetical protein
MVGVRHTAAFCDMLHNGATMDMVDLGCFDLSGIAWIRLDMACGCLLFLKIALGAIRNHRRFYRTKHIFDATSTQNAIVASATAVAQNFILGSTFSNQGLLPASDSVATCGAHFRL